MQIAVFDTYVRRPDGRTMHFDILVAEDFSADDGILDEVLGYAAADHQEAGRPCLDLDIREFSEVRHGVDHHIGLASLCAVDLMFDQAKTSRTIDKGRAENRHVMFICQFDEAVVLLAILREKFPHFADEGPA